MRVNDPEKLTNSEEQVVKLLLTGKDSSEVAAVLGVGKGAVDFHVNNIYKKWKIHNRVQLVTKYLERNKPA